VKKILFILLITLATTILHAQDVYLKWAKQIGGSGSYSVGNSIAVDASGNVFTTGSFTGTVDFDPGPGVFNLIAVGSGNIFVSKLNAAGNFVWAKQMGGTGSGYGSSISLDATGNIYSTGAFGGTVDFDPGVGVFNLGATTSSGDCFVSKLDECGNFLWASIPVTGSGYGTGISIDAAGNAYVSGFFVGAIAIGNDTLGNTGNWSAFIAKYDSGGNAIWGRTPGGTGLDYGTGICTNGNGNIFVTGYFTSSYLNFGGIPVLNDNAGFDDVFIAAYDTGGNAIWAKSVGGQDYDYGMGICTGNNGKIYVTGYLGSYSVNFGNTTLTNKGSNDIFIARLGINTGIEENNLTAWNIFPNPSNGQLTIYHPSLKKACIIEVYNLTGEKVCTQNISCSNELSSSLKLKLEEGLYFMRIICEGESVTRKLIVE